jgi:hypothetical protein
MLCLGFTATKHDKILLYDGRSQIFWRPSLLPLSGNDGGRSRESLQNAKLLLSIDAVDTREDFVIL